MYIYNGSNNYHNMAIFNYWFSHRCVGCVIEYMRQWCSCVTKNVIYIVGVLTLFVVIERDLFI